MKWPIMPIPWFLLASLASALGLQDWRHQIDLDQDFRLSWTPGSHDITFEVQVRSLGFFGLGFTRRDELETVDMVIGWVDFNGNAHLEDRHIKGVSREPQLDSIQNYFLQSGFENKTHMVFRFTRRYDTCDPKDIKLTNDTMEVIWLYNVDKPMEEEGEIRIDGTYHGSRNLYLIQRTPHMRRTESSNSWEVQNSQIRLPADQESSMYCKVFKIPKIVRKHHVTRFKPVISHGNKDFVHHVTLYECRGNDGALELTRLSNGSWCSLNDQMHVQCNAIVFSWNVGSETYNYPPEVGYPLEPFIGPRYFMLETHYTNPRPMASHVIDSSGLRLSYTDQLRKYDAGAMRMGIDPNWRHIIPPGQTEMISEGHCISRCTETTVPSVGINVFSVSVNTHQLGRKVKLRHIRQGRELPPIISDFTYDPNYQEFRTLPKPVKIYPGDHLISECTYSSEKRDVITLGGLSSKEETCLVSVLYYPKTDLSLCYSLPSLPTVLHSLGIEKLEGPSPLRIASPSHLKGMTLEARLVTYDWENNFHNFQGWIRRGTYRALCTNSKGNVLPENAIEAHYPKIARVYQNSRPTCAKKSQRNKSQRKQGREYQNIRSRRPGPANREELLDKNYLNDKEPAISLSSAGSSLYFSLGLLLTLTVIWTLVPNR